MSRTFRYDPNSDSVVEQTAPAPVRRRPAWPRECYASGVGADKAGELREFFQKRGESVDVTSDGDPVYTSAGQEKRCLKMRGMYNKKS
jgi:hypothetical protein